MASILKRLQGKVAIITGGASGIGAASAKLFVQNGAKVVVADIQDDLGESLCKGLQRTTNDSTVSYVHCDVSSEADVKNAVDTTVSKYGELDIMYNNAGIVGDLNDINILHSSTENFKKVVEVNALGALLGAKQAARVMIPRKQGVILFTASTTTVVAREGPHAYTMSKHAVLGLMKNLCVELREHGIRVNCISPCAVATPIMKSGAVLSKGLVMLEAEEVAKTAVYLSSEEAKSVSGLNMIVDEGDYGRSSVELLKIANLIH